MALKNWLHRFGKKNRTAPAVSDRYGVQRRVQFAYPRFQRIEQSARFAGGYVDFRKCAPVVYMHQAAAEHHRVGAGYPAPQIREIDSVEGLPASEADGFELRLAQRLGGNRHRELGFGVSG